VAPPPALRRLLPADASAYRELRLEGLECHPEAFGAAWEDEADKPLDWFARRLAGNTVIGGSVFGAGLDGVAGLMVPQAAKQRHRGVLWGMYVRPDARGSGLAAALVRQVVQAGRGQVEAIRLTVVASNQAAVRVYRAAGFAEYGLERRALKLGSTYYDEMLMDRPLDPPG
jgi:ribosomal protein S18 acetylase RimI-like enzyme